MSMSNPYVVALRIARVSSSALTNAGTALTSLVAIPMLEVLMLVAVAASVGSSDLVSVAYAGALIALGTSIISGTISGVSRDRSMGVLQDALTFRFFHPPYWLAKVTIPAVLGVAVALATIAAILLIDPSHSSDMALRALTLVPPVCLVAGTVSVAAATASVALRDPYLVSNVLTATLPIVAGVVVPITLFPQWLATLAMLVPLTATVQAMWSPDMAPNESALLVARDLAVAAAWLAMGVALSRRVITLLRDGRREDVW